MLDCLAAQDVQEEGIPNYEITVRNTTDAVNVELQLTRPPKPVPVPVGALTNVTSIFELWFLIGFVIAMVAIADILMTIPANIVENDFLYSLTKWTTFYPLKIVILAWISWGLYFYNFSKEVNICQGNSDISPVPTKEVPGLLYNSGNIVYWTMVSWAITLSISVSISVVRFCIQRKRNIKSNNQFEEVDTEVDAQ